jgi:hypothetical protein
MILRALPWWIAIGILTTAYVCIWYVTAQIYGGISAVGLVYAVSYVGYALGLLREADRAMRKA